MTRPGSQLICPWATPYYHCICRCVRRAFLCGEDELTGKDYSHRKGWVLERLALLTEVFCIELYGYAVMANHYHLVIHVNKNKALALTDSEVISRWSRLFVLPVLVERWLEGELMEGAEKAAVIVVRQARFQRVLCQRRLYPQPAQQQQPDFQLGAPHRPL